MTDQRDFCPVGDCPNTDNISNLEIFIPNQSPVPEKRIETTVPFRPPMFEASFQPQLNDFGHQMRPIGYGYPLPDHLMPNERCDQQMSPYMAPIGPSMDFGYQIPHMIEPLPDTRVSQPFWGARAYHYHYNRPYDYGAYAAYPAYNYGYPYHYQPGVAAYYSNYGARLGYGYGDCGYYGQ